MRQAREKAMDEGELRKLGPLALQLIEGLRVPALLVAHYQLINSPKKNRHPSS